MNPAEKELKAFIQGLIDRYLDIIPADVKERENALLSFGEIFNREVDKEILRLTANATSPEGATILRQIKVSEHTRIIRQYF